MPILYSVSLSLSLSIKELERNMVLKLVIMLYLRTLFRAGSADTAREATTTCVGPSKSCY